MNLVDYEGEAQLLRIENAEQVRMCLNADWLLTKITAYATRQGLEPELLIHKVRTDDLFALTFAKDPGKQSMHQRLAQNALIQLGCFDEFRLLPQSGKQAYFVSKDGIPLTGYDAKESKQLGKAVDFFWVHRRSIGTLHAYASHKYTKEEGGAQDNQASDLENFMERARGKSTPDNHVFYALCDGQYYDHPYGSCSSRREWMNKKLGNERVKALRIDDLKEAWMRDILLWESRVVKSR